MSKVYSDFVIIGSGAAGSVLSYFLSKKGFKISLVDSAEIVPKDLVERTSVFSFVDQKPKNYTPRILGVLGGNTEIWGSKIWLMSKHEFKEGLWGFGYTELKEYSKKLANALNIDHKELTGSKVEFGFSLRKSMRAKFKNLYKYLNIGNNQNILTFAEYSPVRIKCDSQSDGSAAKGLTIMNRAGHTIDIDIGKSLIFCAGGLNNSRLILSLLNKCSVLTGCFLNDHPHINVGKFDRHALTRFENISKPYLRQESMGCSEGNYILKDHNFAGIQLDGRVDIVRFMKKIYLSSDNVYARRFVQTIEFFVLKYFGLCYKIMSKLRISQNFFSFEFFFSQTLDVENKLYLSDKVDDFGLPKLNISWKVSQSDISSYDRMIGTVFTKEELRYPGLKGRKNFSIDSVLSGYHPSSTTKIGDDADTGVVDKDLKLFNYGNVYVCGSSVFPSRSVVNPTWTIMSLAARLADHLAPTERP